MAGDRYVLLGMAHVGSPWFREVARWATAAALPIEFVKAVSAEEVRVRLRSGRAFSALLVDDGVAGLDRDLVDLARESGCAVVVVDTGRSTRSWEDLGISALLPTDFARAELLDVLTQVATPVGRTDAIDPVEPEPAPGSWRGRLVAVTGSGGAGRSTVAIALAQGLAVDARYTDVVCLADLALDAEQGMLHDATDVVPGVVELTDAHRGGVPNADDIRAMTWQVTERGYRLLLGLRRHRDWTALRARSFGAALEGLRRTFRVVVADVDADVEGEDSTGSLDVEERNLMARTTLRHADVVVVVGSPGMKGLHSLLRVTRDLIGHGIGPDRLVPIVNRAPRSPRARAEITAAFGQLLASDRLGVPSPAFVPERRRLDDLLRDGARLPDALAIDASRPVRGMLDRAPTIGQPVEDGRTPVAIAPGSLGSWTEHGSGT
jgi:MinD-like ATPase involved in chromosome partitioning or flagellar assembly